MNEPSYLRVVSSNSSKVKATPRSRARTSRRECHLPGSPLPCSSDIQFRIVEGGLSKASASGRTPPKRPTISRASSIDLDMQESISNLRTSSKPKNGLRFKKAPMHVQGYNASMTRTRKIQPPAPPKKGRQPHSVEDDLFKRQVGGRLKMIMQHWGYNQQQFGELLGVSGSQVNKYQNDGRELPPSIIRQLIIWGVSMDFLFAGLGAMFVRANPIRPDHADNPPN